MSGLDIQIVKLSKNRWTWSIRYAGVVLTPLAEVRYKTSKDAETGAMAWREELWADLPMDIETDEGCDKCWTETGVCVECGDHTVLTMCEECGKLYCSMCFIEDFGICEKCAETRCEHCGSDARHLTRVTCCGATVCNDCLSTKFGTCNKCAEKEEAKC